MTFRKTIDLIESLTDANLAHTIAAAISSGEHEGYQPYWKLHADERILSDSDAMAHIAMHVMDGFTSGSHPHWELKVVDGNQDIPHDAPEMVKGRGIQDYLDRSHDMKMNADERAMRNDIGVTEELIDEEVIDMVHAHMVVPVAETHGPGQGWFEVSDDKATCWVVEDARGVPVDHFDTRSKAQEAADKLNGVAQPETLWQEDGSKPYYTLAVCEVDGIWAPQFGDYDRNVVKQEMADMRYSDGNQGIGGMGKAANYKIIMSGDSQDEINAEIAKLNAADDELLTELDTDPTDAEPTGFEGKENFVVIINAIHERGERQAAALRELNNRGLWLSDDQKAQAGLV